ncbi:MAG: DUF2061 domain-containing protein [Phycisphaerae bacterium]|jgi:uncharacterized membrane protein
MESHIRTIAKTLSWRVLATVITFSIVLIVTGKVSVAAGIGLSDTLVKLFVYYLHERAWNRVNYGRKPQPEYHI